MLVTSLDKDVSEAMIIRMMPMTEPSFVSLSLFDGAKEKKSNDKCLQVVPEYKPTVTLFSKIPFW